MGGGLAGEVDQWEDSERETKRVRDLQIMSQLYSHVDHVSGNGETAAASESSGGVRPDASTMDYARVRAPVIFKLRVGHITYLATRYSIDYRTFEQPLHARLRHSA